MLPITQHYDATKVDFKSSMTHKHYELKTKIGTHPTHKNRWFDLSMKQYEENPCDIYVAFYYDREQNELAMAKWISKEKFGELLERKIRSGYREGEDVIERRTFPENPIRDCYQLDYYWMEDIKDLPK